MLYFLRYVHLASKKSASMKGKGYVFSISSLSLKEPIINDGPFGADHGLSVGIRHIQMYEKSACYQPFLHS